MSGIIAQNAANATGLIKAAAGGGAWTLLTTSTASASATVAFTSNIDSTYPTYLFEFNNMHPATNDVFFQFQANAAGGSGFNETIQSTHFRAYHTEDGAGSGLAYRTGNDQVGTAYQKLSEEIGNGNDEALSGYLYLFNPSSTTFVKHFQSRTAAQIGSPRDVFVAGYFNTVSAIDEISFQMSSGNIDAGTIKLYGLGDS